MTRKEEYKKIIYRHVAADGPVGFLSILLECRAQVNFLAEDWEVIPSLNELLYEGYLKLYVDGTSFKATDKEWEE